MFTSGATESNNLAIRGVAERQRRRGDHLVSVATEHKAVLDPLARLARRGYDVTLLGVEQHAAPGCLRQVASGWVARSTRSRRRDSRRHGLVSVMLANNEIGIIQPLAEIAAVCNERGVLLHCDATQAVGKLPVDVRELSVDLLSFTAHKIYGPMGVGALYVRQRDPIVRLEAADHRRWAAGGPPQRHAQRAGHRWLCGRVAILPGRIAARNDSPGHAP